MGAELRVISWNIQCGTFSTANHPGAESAIIESGVVPQSVHLSGPQNRQLQDALVSAFQDVDGLRRYAKHSFDVNLNKIANTQSATQAAFDLILWAESEGRTSDLLHSVLTEKPGNFEIRALAGTLGLLEAQSDPLRLRRGQGVSSYASGASEYILEVLHQLDAHIVCLQEVLAEPARTGVSFAEIRKREQYPHAAFMRLSASHLVDGADMGVAILSRFPLESREIRLPNPDLQITGADGRLLMSHNKGFLVATVDWNGRPVTVACGHLLPLHVFRVSINDTRLRHVRRALKQELTRISRQPAIICADFNLSVKSILPPTTQLQCLVNVPTKRGDTESDNILCSLHWRAENVYVVPSASDHHLCLADLNSFDEPTAPTGPATSIGSKLTQQSGLGKVYLESGSALEAYLIRGHSGGGRPVCGWSHAMEERIVGVVATAYGLKIAELIGLRSRAYVEVRDQIVQTLMDQKLKDGGWTAVSGKRVSRPEATAWVLMALFRSGAYSEAKECTHTLERMFDPPVAHHRVLTLTLALRALAEIKPESPVIPPLVRQLLDSAARDEEGRIKFWGNLCFTAPITDWKQAGRPSAVHTAHSIVALLLTHNCTSGRSGAEASQFAVACDWLLSQVSWKDDEEKIQRPLGDEIDALRVAHYTTPWVIEALLRVGVDPTHPRIQESVRQLLASQNAGLWDWQSIRKPIWATYDALVALTDYSNRRSLVWPE